MREDLASRGRSHPANLRFEVSRLLPAAYAGAQPMAMSRMSPPQAGLSAAPHQLAAGMSEGKQHDNLQEKGGDFLGRQCLDGVQAASAF